MPLSLPFINNGFDYFSKLLSLNILDKARGFPTLVIQNFASSKCQLLQGGLSFPYQPHCNSLLRKRDSPSSLSLCLSVFPPCNLDKALVRTMTDFFFLFIEVCLAVRSWTRCLCWSRLRTPRCISLT